MIRPIIILLLAMPLLPTATAQGPPDCIGGTCVEGACGMVDRPDCWAHRFACFWIARPMAAVAPESVCPLQPGCCNSTDNLTLSSQSRANGAMLAGLVERCDNYGVEVNLVVMSTPCQGPCQNHGVQVNVVVSGSHCTAACQNTGVVVSVGQSCGGTLVTVCVDTICSQPCGGSGCTEASTTTSRSPCEGDLTGLCGCGTTGPSIAVGLTSCARSCANYSVAVVVGIQDCPYCGNNGLRVIVGFSCGQQGIGACYYEFCRMVIDGHNGTAQANQRPMGVMMPPALGQP